MDQKSGVFLRFIACTGCRLGAALAVEWKDVIWASRTISFEQDGNRPPSDLTEEAYEILDRLSEGRRDLTDRIFPYSDRAVKKARSVLKRCVKGLVNNKLTDLKDMHYPHALRHYFASVCVMAGVDHGTIALWLGHNDGWRLVSTTYGHLNREHTRNQIKKIRLTSES